MRPRFSPTLVNGRSGDPALFVDFRMERRAMLLDLGDLSALPARAAMRLSDVFVSHAHIDHFFGFDHLLRLFVGREKRLGLYGPPEFIDRVEAKLNGYTWNLAARFAADFVLSVTEVHPGGQGRRARFRLKTRFARESEETVGIDAGLIVDEPSVRVRTVALEHRTPSLAFAVQEPEHVNIWRNRLDEMGLAVGPWLTELKAAVFRGMPAETPVAVRRAGGGEDILPLGPLRERIVSITPGQKLAYVTDAAYSPANAEAILGLARDADILFIEAVFSTADTALAEDRAHLTTAQAGELARRAGVARVEPFHFSPRYAGRESGMLAEVEAAFRGARPG